jgi:hypothetical protein
MKHWVSSLLGGFVLLEQCTASLLSLDGKWRLENDIGNVSIPAAVPGQVHTDLLLAQGTWVLLAPAQVHCTLFAKFFVW